MRLLPFLAAFLLTASILIALNAAPAGTGVPPTPPQKVRVTQVLRTRTTTSGGPITLRDGAVELVAAKYDIAADASLPIHKHRFPRFGYVLSGRLMVTNAQTHGFRIFSAGDVIVEDLDTWHTARALKPQPVELLVIDLGHPGASYVLSKD